MKMNIMVQEGDVIHVGKAPPVSFLLIVKTAPSEPIHPLSPAMLVTTPEAGTLKGGGDFPIDDNNHSHSGDGAAGYGGQSRH